MPPALEAMYKAFPSGVISMPFGFENWAVSFEPSSKPSAPDPIVVRISPLRFKI